MASKEIAKKFQEFILFFFFTLIIVRLVMYGFSTSFISVNGYHLFPIFFAVTLLVFICIAGVFHHISWPKAIAIVTGIVVDGLGMLYFNELSTEAYFAGFRISMVFAILVLLFAYFEYWFCGEDSK